jgi:hypothetical protein
MELTLIVSMTPAEFSKFIQPIAGDGGGQIFVRRMQDAARLQNRKAKTEAKRELMISGSDVERWFKYRDNYGPGGFQTRLGRPPAESSGDAASA